MDSVVLALYLASEIWLAKLESDRSNIFRASTYGDEIIDYESSEPLPR